MRLYNSMPVCKWKAVAHLTVLSNALKLLSLSKK